MNNLLKEPDEYEKPLMDWIKSTPDNHPSKWKINYGLLCEIFKAGFEAGKVHNTTALEEDKDVKK